MCASASSTSSHLTADELHAAGGDPLSARHAAQNPVCLCQLMRSLACSSDLVCISHIVGIQPGLIRISTGITGSLQQRMQQLVQAVQSVKQHQ